jgi:hypothetical protein
MQRSDIGPNKSYISRVPARTTFSLVPVSRSRHSRASIESLSRLSERYLCRQVGHVPYYDSVSKQRTDASPTLICQEKEHIHELEQTEHCATLRQLATSRFLAEMLPNVQFDNDFVSRSVARPDFC